MRLQSACSYSCAGAEDVAYSNSGSSVVVAGTGPHIRRRSQEPGRLIYHLLYAVRTFIYEASNSRFAVTWSVHLHLHLLTHCWLLGQLKMAGRARDAHAA